MCHGDPQNLEHVLILKVKVLVKGVETMGLEPTTPCLQSRCSSQLSYVPRFGADSQVYSKPALRPARLASER